MASDLNNIYIKEKTEPLMLPKLYDGYGGVDEKLESLKQSICQTSKLAMISSYSR